MAADRKGSADAPAGRPGAPRPMVEDEACAFLARGRWGVLSMVEHADGSVEHEGGTSKRGHGALPYAVPVSYAFHRGGIVIVLSEGRKTRNLDDEPDACFTVVEVTGREAWASVNVRGRVVWLNGVRERVQALASLRRQLNPEGLPSRRSIQGAMSARIARLDPVEITGRVAGG